MLIQIAFKHEINLMTQIREGEGGWPAHFQNNNKVVFSIVFNQMQMCLF